MPREVETKALYDAIMKGDLEGVKQVFQRKKKYQIQAIINSTDYEGYENNRDKAKGCNLENALHIAVEQDKNNSPKIVKYLLARGADIDAKLEDGRTTPLSLAKNSKNEGMAGILENFSALALSPSEIKSGEKRNVASVDDECEPPAAKSFRR
jgi:ankyrin repeat protein